MNLSNLFYDMKNVCKNDPERFFMNVTEFKGIRTMMFDYSLTMTFHFDTVAARNCRGSLFQVDENDDFVAVLSFPFEKFFNHHEMYTTHTQGTYASLCEQYGVDNLEDGITIKRAYNKEDGSLISTLMIDGELYTKSSSSLTSEHAVMSRELLLADQDLYEKVLQLEHAGYTVMFEFESSNPKYQIVLQYPETRLVVLGARSRIDGHYMEYDDIVQHFGVQRVVPTVDVPDDMDAFLDNAENVEGLVVEYTCGLRQKFKCDWYLEQHRYKDNIFRSPKYVWKAMVEGTIDDYTTLTDGIAAQHAEVLINKSQELLDEIINGAVSFYEENKHLDTKEYHIKLYKSGLYDAVKKRFITAMASNLKRGDTVKEAFDGIKESLTVQRNIAKLGILEWS